MIIRLMAANDPTIRAASLEDYAGVCRLLDGVDALHHANLPWMFQQPAEPPRTAAYFAGLLNGADSAVYVADAGSIVGVAYGFMRAAPELPIFVQQRWGVLDGLAVDATWRRRGLGSSLVRAIEAWAIGAGAAWVELSVYDFNAEARRFYETLGYLPLRTVVRKPR